MEYINNIVKIQREYFESGKTLSIDYRKKQLKKLYDLVKKYEPEIMEAIKKDLNKSNFEAYETEIGLVYEEIKFMLKNIDKFAKPKKVKTPLAHFPSKSFIYKEPYGLVLIIAPWNYPFQLAMMPLIAAIATGNCTIVKPSNYSSFTSEIIAKILSTFDENYIAVIQGNRKVNESLLVNKFDYIFFTGSVKVGKIIMEKVI